MSGLGAELRQALRRLARRPAVSLLAVALLAVGLGGNLALDAVLDAILFRQAPVREAGRLVRVVRSDAARETYDNWSYPTADDLRRDAATLADAAIFVDWRTFHVSPGGGANERVAGGIATGNYFELLGLRPQLGRFFAPADDRAANPAAVVVLSDDFWRTRFGADPAVVGREIGVNGRRLTVLGVAPRGFRSLDPTMAPQLWVPMSAWTALLADDARAGLLAERGSSWLDVVARLAPGATVQAAQAELDGRLAALAAAYPDELMVETADGREPARTWVMPVDVARLGGPAEASRVERQAALVAAVGALVLLVVGANLAALLAARAAQSGHDTALRAALGASPLQRSLPQFAEGTLLALAGAALAWPVAAAATRVAGASLGFVLPLAATPELGLAASPWFAAATVALLVGATVLVGGLPAVVAARLDPIRALRLGGAPAPGRKRTVSDLLLAGQVALSVVLLVAALVVVGRWRELAAVDPGFRAEGVAQASVDLGLQRYAAGRAGDFQRELTRRAEAAFGAGNVALTDWTPLAGGWSRTTIAPQGYPLAPGENPQGDVAWASPEIFRVLGIRLRAGRSFDAHDDLGAPRVAVINATMARRYFAGRDPLGATFRIGLRPDGAAITVVGVVDDARYRDFAGEVPPMFFRPLAQSESPRLRLAILARAAAPAAALGELRRIVAGLDPELPLYATGLLADQAAAALGDERRAAALFAGFATLVLTIAAAGLGALTLVAVARRRREIAVRLALGAGAGAILLLLTRRIAALVAAGAAAGVLAIALLLPRLGELAGARAELSTARIVPAIAALVLTAAVAAWLPARRALGIDPAESLRSE